jgi:hypothetical protein
VGQPGIAEGLHPVPAEPGFSPTAQLSHQRIDVAVLRLSDVQDDIAIYGVTCLLRVTDATTGGALHVEAGMWLNIPATANPQAEASTARLATIPHGNAFCVVGFAEDETLDKPPTPPPPANTVPFPIELEPPPPGTKNPFHE